MSFSNLKNMFHKRILIVEDEEMWRLGTTLHLKSFGYDIVGTFKSGIDAIEQCVDLKPDLILMDIELEGELDGIETVKQIQEKLDVPIIYLSYYSDKETIERAKSTNPFSYMVKPINETELQFTLEMAINSYKKEKLLKKLKIHENVLSNVQGIVYRLYVGENWKIHFFNDMLEKMTGFKLNELENHETHFLISRILEKDRKNVINALSDSINLKKTFNVKYEIKNKDGKIRLFYEMGKPVYGINGEIIHIDGTVFDITSD